LILLSEASYIEATSEGGGGERVIEIADVTNVSSSKTPIHPKESMNKIAISSICPVF
jgi:hypothetical protein